MIDLGVVPFEDHLGVAVFVGLDSQTCILLDAVDRQLFALQVGVFVLFGVLYARDSGRLLIQCQRDAVEQGGLAGTRIARDEEDAGGAACDGVVQPVLEVDVGGFDRCDIPNV